MASKGIKSALEAMMFTWGVPLEASTAAEVLNLSVKETKEALEELMTEYEQEERGIRLRRIEKGYQFVTAEEMGSYVERLCTPVRKRKLSQSALEVLAIIAYKQPVTKGEIEAIRGIRCDRVLEGLMNKSLVEQVGRSEAIGRPLLYGTTTDFLRFFNLSDLKELPDIQDIEEAVETPEGYEEGIMANQMSLEDIAVAAQGAVGENGDLNEATANEETAATATPVEEKRTDEEETAATAAPTEEKKEADDKALAETGQDHEA